MIWLAVALTQCLSAASPYLPQSDDQVLQRLQSRPFTVQRELSQLRQASNAQPQDATKAADLAQRYIELARSESDVRLWGYAQGVLQPWWSNTGAPPAIMLLRATIKQHFHDFAGALDDLQQVPASDDNFPQALLTKAVIHRVLGQYSQAMAACQQLRGLVPAPVSITCAATLDSRQGRASQAAKQLRGLVESAQVATGVRSWILIQLAEALRLLGQFEDADKYFAQAQEHQASDYVLNNRADLWLQQGQPKFVLDMLSSPSSIGQRLRVARAAQSVGDSHLVQQNLEVLQAHIRETQLRGDKPHTDIWAAVELYFGDPKQALTLALDNWQTQREPQDARLCLAAAVQAKDRIRIAPVVQWLQDVGQQDAQSQAYIKQLDLR